MLRCADGSYYVGSTSTELERRVAEHQSGHYDGYTARRRPVTLAWPQEFPDITQAVAVERQLKGWNRVKKEALMRGDFDVLHVLARRGSSSFRS